MELKSSALAFIMETVENELLSWITTQLNERDWSQRKLAKEAGLSHTQISNVLSSNRTITFDFCAAIARAFGEPEEKVFRLAGLLPPLPASEDSPTLKELWELVKRLSPEEREEVFRYTRYRYQQEQEAKRAKRSGLDAAESTS